MPTPTKPGDRRQRRNKPDQIDAQVVALNTARKSPAAPEMLTEALREEWQKLWKSELAATYTDSDVPALRRMFELRHRVVEFESEVFVDGGKAVIETAGNQMWLHPLLKQADVYRAQILALEDRFGLNPQSRLKLGIALGQAQQSLDDMNSRIAKRVGSTDNDNRPDPRITAIDTA